MGPDFRHGDALTFHMVNRNKKSVALDLKSAAGMADFERLAASADILIHNLRPGAPEALGIDGPSLTARHPRLIYCAISAFGHIGPMKDRPGYEPLIQATAVCPVPMAARTIRRCVSVLQFAIKAPACGS